MMEPRLTPDQLSKVVREVELLALRDQDDLSQDQVRQILQELGLPPVLLEDAMVQVQRREALDRQQQQRKWRVIGGVSVAALAIATALGLNQTHRNTGKLYYRVTLNQAPLGQKLPLSCTWTDPQGQVAQQTQYQTKPIETPIWNTHCRTTLGPSAAAGSWQVKLTLNGRLISDERFDLRP
jgi:hypothetical protein